MSCKNCKNLESALLDYVEQYGLTPAARQYFAESAASHAQREPLSYTGPHSAEPQHSTLGRSNLTELKGYSTMDLSHPVQRRGIIWLFVKRFLLCFGFATACVVALNLVGWL